MLRQALVCALLVGCSSEASNTAAVDGTGGAGGAPMLAGEAGETAAAGAAGSDFVPDTGPAPPGDTCDDVVDANRIGSRLADGTLFVTGHNYGAHKDLGVCEPGVTPVADVFYSYTPEASGGLSWQLEAVTPTRFVVDVRTECIESSSTVQCEYCGLRCGGSLEVTAGEPLYFAIFGVPTTNSKDGTGTFDLSLHLTPDPGVGDACMSPYHGGRACPPDTLCHDAEGETAICGEQACGDGLLSFEPLECDDGNGDSGDGCSSVCEPDAQGGGGASCEAPVTLNLPRMRNILDPGVFSYAIGTGELVGGSDLGAGCATAAGPEAVYVFELAVASHVDIATEGADVVSVRRAGATDCGTEELACAMDTASSKPGLALQLEPGRYSVILDREEPTLAPTPSYLVDVFVLTR